MINPIDWHAQTRTVRMLDQTRLPTQEIWLDIADVDTMAEAIYSLRVRGAPAIGIAAAYGVVLAACRKPDSLETVEQAIEQLAATRPTAVNLFWALDRMRMVLDQTKTTHPEERITRLLAEANAIQTEDQEAGRRLGEHGDPAFKKRYDIDHTLPCRSRCYLGLRYCPGPHVSG